MILRSLILLGVGAAIAGAAPAFAAGKESAVQTQTASAVPAESTTTPATAKATTATATPSSVASLETAVPKTETPVVKKVKKAKKKVAKAKKPVEEAKPEKPKTLFAALFGGDIKDKTDDATDAKKKKADAAAKAKAKVAKVAVKPKAEVAKPVEPAEILPAITANTGELRSEKPDEKPDFFATLFGGASKQSMLPETRALDSVLEKKQAKKKFKVKAAFVPQEVEFSGYPSGTIVIDTSAKFLYLVEDSSTARRYAIAVGREGLQYKGNVKVGDKQEWPRWFPTKEMQAREPKKYGIYPDGMDGGPDNPLGARAIYLYDGKHDTHLRIHGTNQPQSIGSAASNGCFRMINDHVMDLYSRVKIGTPVVVL